MPYPNFRNDLEKNTYYFLRGLELNDIDGGNSFLVGGHQLDLCGGHQETLLVIDCTSQRNLKDKVIDHRGKALLYKQGFKKIDRYKKYKKFKYIVVTDDIASDNLFEYANISGELPIYVWDKKFISSYKTLINSIGGFAKYSVLSELDVVPSNDNQIVIPAFRRKLSSRKNDFLFIFYIEAKHLLEISYVARRELGGEFYYQRMINNERLKKIAKTYINKEKFFPNNIIVALDEDGWEFQKKESSLQFSRQFDFGQLILGKNYRSCWIIDGQHRLLSYAHSSRKDYLIVSAFGRMDEKTQGEYFLDINRNAKPVKPDLIWDILGTIHPTTPDGFVSNTAKKIQGIPNSFFHNKINIPSIGKGPFSINTICERLKRTHLCEDKIPARQGESIKNPFWNHDPEKFQDNLSKGISRAFTKLDSLLETEVSEQLYSNGVVAVFLQIYALLLTFKKKRPNPEDLDDFYKPLAKLFNSYDIGQIKTLRKMLNSEGGRTEFRNVLIGYQQDNYDQNFAIGLVEIQPSLGRKIGQLELDLNKMVYIAMQKEYGESWEKDSQYFSDTEKRKRIEEKAKIADKPFYDYMDFNHTLDSIIMKRNLWINVFKEIFIGNERFIEKDQLKTYAKDIWRFRCEAEGHVHSGELFFTREQIAIIENEYKILKKIVHRKLKELE